MKKYNLVYSHAVIEFANKVQTYAMKNLNESKKDQYIYMTLPKTLKLWLHQFLNYQTLNILWKKIGIDIIKSEVNRVKKHCDQNRCIGVN